MASTPAYNPRTSLDAYDRLAHRFSLLYFVPRFVVDDDGYPNTAESMPRLCRTIHIMPTMRDKLRHADIGREGLVGGLESLARHMLCYHVAHSMQEHLHLCDSTRRSYII